MPYIKDGFDLTKVFDRAAFHEGHDLHVSLHSHDADEPDEDGFTVVEIYCSECASGGNTIENSVVEFRRDGTILDPPEPLNAST